ncbi:hypothetical protein A946_11470 [Methylacidiphilum kamchatkense Kam1]|uniref:Secreted protein n=1 Tax=Methylacidiphilum kamchatkense Kam1 TaxID=1202785 RepID=A0ABR4ZU16_9BACT|nr:hypothetical protein [Methylacidiphilum kamchatkense]KIE57747.1 hypothetical protein A946_11470 [Methylacidiphilum kamchatkense Kam1]
MPSLLLPIQVPFLVVVEEEAVANHPTVHTIRSRKPLWTQFRPIKVLKVAWSVWQPPCFLFSIPSQARDEKAQGFCGCSSILMKLSFLEKRE